MNSNAADPVLLLQHDDGCSLELGDGTVQSRMLHAQPKRLVLEYTRMMMGFLLFQPNPARIAMIGLGGGSIAKYCLATLPDTDFIAIEISPEVIALRDAFGIPSDGPRFRVRCQDGAEFVRHETQPLNVLLVDGFDGAGQPAGLCSPAFYDACRERLADDGVLVVNRHLDLALDGVFVDRIADAFDGRTVVIDANESENQIVFAGTADPFPPSFDLLGERRRTLEPTHRFGLAGIARKILRSAKTIPRRSHPRGSARAPSGVGFAR